MHTKFENAGPLLRYTGEGVRNLPHVRNYHDLPYIHYSLASPLSDLSSNLSQGRVSMLACTQNSVNMLAYTMRVNEHTGQYPWSEHAACSLLVIRANECDLFPKVWNYKWFSSHFDQNIVNPFVVAAATFLPLQLL